MPTAREQRCTSRSTWLLGDKQHYDRNHNGTIELSDLYPVLDEKFRKFLMGARHLGLRATR